MIQRIQTIYLLLASIFGFLSIRFSFYISTDVTQINKSISGNSNFLFLIVIACVASFSLLSIFLFKNSKLQTRIVIISLILSFTYFYFMYLLIKTIPIGSWSLSAVYYFVQPILLILAFINIRKDVQLLKNMDRIR